MKTRQSTILQALNLSVGYPNAAPLINNVNVSVSSGDRIAVVGENGKGKTTLLKTICGLLNPTAGEIMIDGQNISQLSAQRLASEISLVLTEKPSLGNIKVKNLISFGRYPFTNWLGIQKDKDHQKIEESIELCQVAHLANKSFAEISDGERQKVMIARAIAQDTRIMILDEPTSHLDVTNRLNILNLLTSLSERKNMAIIYSTHEVELALKNSDRMWLVSEGSLQEDTPDGLLQSGHLTNAFSLPAGYFSGNV